MERMQFNTAIARLMEFINVLTSKGASRQDLTDLVKLIGPFAPHLADEAWEMLGNKGFVIAQSWPVFDDALTKDDTVTVVVQVNGKLRAEFSAAADATQDSLREKALSLDKVRPFCEGKTVKKVVVVPKKLVNIVVG
jgi:leucyl-tRNA synthetase